jgi:hypothetical protein
VQDNTSIEEAACTCAIEVCVLRPERFPVKSYPSRHALVCEVFWEEDWYDAEVRNINIAEQSVLVHYVDGTVEEDEWIPLNKLNFRACTDEEEEEDGDEEMDQVCNIMSGSRHVPIFLNCYHFDQRFSCYQDFLVSARTLTFLLSNSKRNATRPPRPSESGALTRKRHLLPLSRCSRACSRAASVRKTQRWSWGWALPPSGGCWSSKICQHGTPRMFAMKERMRPCRLHVRQERQSLHPPSCKNTSRERSGDKSRISSARGAWSRSASQRMLSTRCTRRACTPATPICHLLPPRSSSSTIVFGSYMPPCLQRQVSGRHGTRTIPLTRLDSSFHHEGAPLMSLCPSAPALPRCSFCIRRRSFCIRRRSFCIRLR